MSLTEKNVLEAGDVRAFRASFAHRLPHLPQPKDDGQAEIVMHHARTQSRIVDFKYRAYSHRWLTERGIPSALPDKLRPKAERMYPKIVSAVGIACCGRSDLGRALAPLLQTAMENAVMDCYANGDTDAAIVRPRMMAARAQETQRLLGVLTIAQANS